MTSSCNSIYKHIHLTTTYSFEINFKLREFLKLERTDD